MSIFRKKDVGLAQTEMKRHLTLRDVVLLGIGAMVGTGIFTMHPQIAMQIGRAHV